ncbi:MAG TPA: gamma-glutamyl-gamma-aminobutyrate hydrolase family protein [Acidimicrobiia bacterium]
MRPTAGVTAWRRTLDTFYGPDRLQTLSTHYVDSLIAAGVLPVIFPNGQSPEDASALVSLVDGILVSGGDDLDPATYGHEVTHSKKYDADVDRFEIALVAAAREQMKPVLAICRGLQLLNIAMGGTLQQEVTTPGGVHDTFDGITPDEMNARRHVVRFQEGSMLADLYGAAEAKVNTLHHQGIDRLGDELVVEGVTEDGLIEAVRFDGDWWVLGVQWHPERMEGEHQRLFAAFREAMLQSRSRITA